MLKVENITKYYNKNKAVDNLSFTVEKGDIFGIVGLSGAGKSTLIRTINKLENIDEGEIIVDNKNVSELYGNSKSLSN